MASQRFTILALATSLTLFACDGGEEKKDDASASAKKADAKKEDDTKKKDDAKAATAKKKVAKTSKKGAAAAASKQKSGAKVAANKTKAQPASDAADVECTAELEGLAWCDTDTEVVFCTDGGWYVLDCGVLMPGAFCGTDENLAVDCYVADDIEEVVAEAILEAVVEEAVEDAIAEEIAAAALADEF